MSDLSALINSIENGKNPVQAVEAFATKEWSALQNLIANLPVDIKPLAQEAQADVQAVLVDAVEWGGTALSAYVTTNGGNLATEVLNLLQGSLGATNPTSAAGQTVIQGFTKLILALVAHATTDGVNALAPQSNSGQS